MWFSGASWWTLLVAALCMVVGFWFGERHKRKQRIKPDTRLDEYERALKAIRDGGGDIHGAQALDALKRIYGPKS